MTHRSAARFVLITAGVLLAAPLLLAPVIALPLGAFRDGPGAWFAAVTAPATLSALKLTLLVAGIAVPLNTLFGLCAALCLTGKNFAGKTLLRAVTELPLSVPPVIAGLITVLMFGIHGTFGGFLAEHGVRIIFAVPGLVLVTLFVSLPYVVRELVPLMEERGREEEEAALLLGASPFMTFLHVTLPGIRSALMSGMLLCNARAMGEFGAVAVVSGHIRGMTDTLPLEIDALYNDYDFTGAFAVATLLLLPSAVVRLFKRGTAP